MSHHASTSFWKSFPANLPLHRLSVVAFSALLTANAAGQDSGLSESGSSSDCSVSVMVRDESGQSVTGARLVALRWTGVWEKLGVDGVSDDSGQARLSGLPTDTYLAIRVEADGYAAAMFDVEFSKPEQRKVELKLSSAVSPAIKVIDPRGQPIVAAEIHRMEYVDANGNTTYLTQRTARSLGYDLDPSDESGLLLLPQLPRDARLKIAVVHPNWKLAELRGLVASDGEIASVTLNPGVQFRIELVPSDGVPESLDRLQADVSFFSQATGTTDPVTINHPFTISKNRIDMTVYDRVYQQLRVKMEDYFVTPEFINVPSSPVSQLDISSAGARTIRMNVRPKVRTTGKVVDRDGKPMQGVELWGAISSTSAEWPVIESKPGEPETDESKIARLRREWASAGNATTDSDGSYEVQLAAGKANIEAYHLGYFSQPHVTEFEVNSDGSTTIPTITLFPVPTLRGVVRDTQGRGVGGMVVRMRSLGRGDAEPVAKTKPDGSFELKMSRIPYQRSGGGLVPSVYVVAFDPHSDLAGLAEVAVSHAEATNNITVDLAPRSVQWVLNPLKEIEPEEDAQVAKLQRQRIDATRRALPDGLPGKPVPDLSEGTWLNTEARSLADFRGRYVLLDFWFIGCGPCQRDMPSIKMCQEMFSDRNFSVVGVHRKGQSPESVQAFADSNGMHYPIVVDDAAGTITDQYRLLGVSGYPSYILLDPEGRIVHNDRVSPPPSLRRYKLERIYQALHQ